MCRHIYKWNNIDCDVKQSLNETNQTSTYILQINIRCDTAYYIEYIVLMQCLYISRMKPLRMCFLEMFLDSVMKKLAKNIFLSFTLPRLILFVEK